MSVIGNTAGLLFRIDADSSDFKRELAALDSSINSVGGKMSTFGGAATVAAAGVAAIGAAALGAGKFLFDLTNSTADYASIVFDATQKTGLAAETISSLKVAADQSGSSLEAVTGGIAKFAKTIGEAADGSENAQAKLAKIGVTASDMETALSQALQTIAKYPPGVQQMTAAQAAFGKSGADLLPFLASFKGDLPGLIAKMKELGVTMSDQNVKAADEFGDTLDTLTTQAAGVGRQFAFEMMPAITRAMQSVSGWLVANQGTISAWGRGSVEVLSGVVNAYRGLAYGAGEAFNHLAGYFHLNIRATSNWAENILKLMTPVLTGFRQLAGIADGIPDQIAAGTNAATDKVKFAIPKIAMPKISSGGGKGGGGKVGKSAEDTAREAYQAQIDDLKRMLANYEAVSSRIIAKAELDLAKGLADETHVADLKMVAAERVASYKLALLEKELDAARKYGQKTVDIEARIGVAKENQQELEFQNETAQLNRTAAEKEKLANRIREIDERLSAELIAINQQRQDNFIKSEEDTWDDLIDDQQGFTNEQNKLRGEASNYMVGLFERERDRKLKVLDDQQAAEKAKIDKEIKDEEAKQKLLFELEELYKQKRLFSEEEFQQRKKEIEDKYSIPVSSGENAKYGPFQGLIDGWTQFVAQVKADGPELTQTMQAIGGMFLNAFEGMANALGSVVSQWVLMGTTGPAVMRKILASALASIAAEAAVRAIMELAYGFAALFLNPGEAAAHFTAAALFGSVALGAGLAGRAVAGNAFKQQSQAATGSSAGSTANSGQGSAGKAGVYSSQEDMIVERGRNTIAGRLGTVVVKIQTTKDHVLDVVTEGLRNNSPIRVEVQNAVA